MAGRCLRPDVVAVVRDVDKRFVPVVNGVANAEFREGRAEAIPSDDGSADVVLTSLSLMGAIDRAAAAREIARVLRPGGPFAAAVWANATHLIVGRRWPSS